MRQTSWGSVSSLLTCSKLVERLFKEAGLPVLIRVKSLGWTTGWESSASLRQHACQGGVPFGWTDRTRLTYCAPSFVGSVQQERGLLQLQNGTTGPVSPGIKPGDSTQV